LHQLSSARIKHNHTLVVAVSCPWARLHTPNQTRKRLQPGSNHTNTSNKATGRSRPSSGWPEPGSLARPSRAGISNTPKEASSAEIQISKASNGAECWDQKSRSRATYCHASLHPLSILSRPSVEEATEPKLFAATEPSHFPAVTASLPFPGRRVAAAAGTAAQVCSSDAAASSLLRMAVTSSI
jgi:hypothetical protein